MQKPIHVHISFVRHGETEKNKKGLLQGPKEELNETGITQAKKLSENFSKNLTYNVNLVLTSNHARAVRTAKEIQEKLIEVQKEQVPFIETGLLGERIIGILEGEPFADPILRLKKKGIDFTDFKCPVAHYSLNEIAKEEKSIETSEEIDQRVTNALQFIFKSIHEKIDEAKTIDVFTNPKTPFHVVVVSHGWMLPGLFGELIMGSSQWMPVELGNTSLTTIGVRFKKDDHFHFSNAFIEKMNDITHLQ
eukprot:gene3995-7251_t